MIRRAIFLAANKGRRANGHDVPAPLLEVGGITLIKRSLLALEQHGINDVVVVVGYRGEEVRRSVTSDPDISARIIWVENQDWHLPNGQSLLKARPYVDEPALVINTEVIFAPEMLDSLVDMTESQGLATVLIDDNFGRVYDLLNLTKVNISDERAVSIGEDLQDFNAVAVGLTVVQPELLDFLDNKAGQDAMTFNGLLQEAAAAGQLYVHDIGDCQWQEISSPETRLHAEWLVRAYGDDLSGHPKPRHSLVQQSTRDPQRTLSYIEGLLQENNAKHYVLFNPGPVLTSPRVKSALVHYDVCHRDSDYSAVVRRLQLKLRRVCRGGPEHDVELLSGSGTAAMEATISSCIPHDGRLLVVSNGAFGERFSEIAEVHRIPIKHVRYEWGRIMDPRDVAQALDDDPWIVAVVMCHHETSVGILNPVQEIGNICRKRDRLFFVDAVSSLAGEDIDVRRDKIDVLISSANKCIHAISGVSFACIHNRVWPRIENIAPRVYYLDLKRYHRISKSIAQTPFTPAVSNFFALDMALDELLKEGVAHRVRHYRALNKRIRKALKDLGLVQFTDTGHESHTISTWKVPDYISFSELYESLKSRGYIIYAGKDHLKDNYFQIANMGELTDEMIQGLLDTLALILKRAAQRRRVPNVKSSPVPPPPVLELS